MRLHDWPIKMAAIVEENRGRVRDYGQWDCCQYMALHVLAITSVDHRDKFPKYGSKREGLLILEKHGGLDGLLTGIFGPYKPVSFAQRGDLVLADLGDGLAGGVCFGVDTWTVSPGGLEPIKTLSGSKAWTIE